MHYTITAYRRITNSKVGNPRYRFDLEGGGMVRTPVNAGWVYALSPESMIGQTFDMHIVGNTVYSITPLDND